MRTKITKKRDTTITRPAKWTGENLLVKYLNKNLNQIIYIFWLSVFVMIVGFGILVWGVSILFVSPDSVMSAAIVSSAGVLTEFVGATFLLIYREAHKQAEKYFKILERNSTSKIDEEIP